jgi:hypothetical protein
MLRRREPSASKEKKLLRPMHMFPIIMSMPALTLARLKDHCNCVVRELELFDMQTGHMIWATLQIDQRIYSGLFVSALHLQLVTIC